MTAGPHFAASRSFTGPRIQPNHHMSDSVQLGTLTSLTPRGDRAGDGRRNGDKWFVRSSYIHFLSRAYLYTERRASRVYVRGPGCRQQQASILPTKMIGGRGVARRTARRTARRQGAIQEMCVYYAGISWGGSAEAPPR